ncbi:hypothetical protein C8R46DRAFT_1209818 [Mycena filopes]|nr:hypothetical protein C8R46DRAFT_1209818 [Mycena filopes]
MSDSPSPALPHKISNPWGIVFIGSTISSILYGITVIQTFMYYRTWGNDARGTKLVVFVLLVLDTLHQVTTTWVTYQYVISTFGDPAALNINHWTLGLGIFCTALVAFIVESFLIYRVWHLSGQNKMLTVIGVPFALAHLGECESQPYQATQDYERTGTNLASPILGTDDMVGRIIAMTIATGMLTSLVGLANILSLVIAPKTLRHSIFSSRVYVNSMLASLNARNAIRTVGQSTFLGNLNSTSPSQGNFTLQSVAEFPRPDKVHVNIDLHQHVDSEDSMRKCGGAPV